MFIAQCFENTSFIGYLQGKPVKQVFFFFKRHLISWQNTYIFSYYLLRQQLRVVCVFVVVVFFVCLFVFLFTKKSIGIVLREMEYIWPLFSNPFVVFLICKMGTILSICNEIMCPRILLDFKVRLASRRDSEVP